MKILLSAYACEPGIGTKPGVGWNWALTLGRQGHEVTHDMTRDMYHLAVDPDRLSQLSRGALKRVKSLTWENQASLYPHPGKRIPR